jgi:purine nucleoside permease
MEDTGTLQSLTFLAKAKRVDLQRVLVLRTASDYDYSQRPGVSAAESLASTKIGHYVAYIPALEAAWRVGSVVVHNLVENWARYQDVMPPLAYFPNSSTFCDVTWRSSSLRSMK